MNWQNDMHTQNEALIIFRQEVSAYIRFLFNFHGLWLYDRSTRRHPRIRSTICSNVRTYAQIHFLFRAAEPLFFNFFSVLPMVDAAFFLRFITRRFGICLITSPSGRPPRTARGPRHYTPHYNTD